MSRFWSDLTRRLSPHVPGEQPRSADLVKLNTNENRYPPSPDAVAVLSGEIDPSLCLYPNPNSQALKDAVARSARLDPSNVFVGNGSGGVLALSYMAFFAGGHGLSFSDITYSFNPVYCQLFDVQAKRVPLADDFRIDLGTYRGAQGGIMFPNQNAPTDIALPMEEIGA